MSRRTGKPPGMGRLNRLIYRVRGFKFNGNVPYRLPSNYEQDGDYMLPVDGGGSACTYFYNDGVLVWASGGTWSSIFTYLRSALEISPTLTPYYIQERFTEETRVAWYDATTSWERKMLRKRVSEGTYGFDNRFFYYTKDGNLISSLTLAEMADVVLEVEDGKLGKIERGLTELGAETCEPSDTSVDVDLIVKWGPPNMRGIRNSLNIQEVGKLVSPKPPAYLHRPRHRSPLVLTKERLRVWGDRSVFDGSVITVNGVLCVLYRNKNHFDALVPGDDHYRIMGE